MFPDRAVLPEKIGLAGANSTEPGGDGGASSAGQAEEAGQSQAGDSNGQAGSTGGATNGGQATGGATTIGAMSGMSGVGGTVMSCIVTHQIIAATADAWIDATNPTTNHGSEPQLIVLGGLAEQRALLAFPLPTATAGQVLKAASLVFSLLASGPTSQNPRVLQLHTLTQAFTEGRVTWNNYANGAARKWLTPGGDFAATFGSGTVEPGATTVRLDTTAQVELALATNQAELDALVLEDSSSSASVYALAFGSRDGLPATSPVLDLEYCAP